jgi:uncharacterized membrane protein
MSRSPVPSHEEIDNRPVKCQVCGKEKMFAESMPAEMVRDSLVRIIRRDVPGWMPDGYICRDDLELYRGRLVSEVLEVGTAEAGTIEAMVAKSIAEEELVSRNVNEEFDIRATLGQRLADRMASFGGSWTFIILFMTVLIVWILINTVALLSKQFDPYPYILLNLVLSCLAAIQAPVILMSQNRQAEIDRQTQISDYEINLKAELEIELLHHKMDLLRTREIERLTHIIEELSERLPKAGS